MKQESQEIPMPNIPSSASSIQPKKRKLTSNIEKNNVGTQTDKVKRIISERKRLKLRNDFMDDETSSEDDWDEIEDIVDFEFDSLT